MALPKPINRIDYYLSKIAGEYKDDTPAPIQRKDFYLAKIAGDYTGTLQEPITRQDFYLAKIAGDYSGATPKPITRIDYYLSAIAGDYDGMLPEPITRQEIYLAQIANQGQYVTKYVQGESILLTDSIEAPLQGLKLFGKSTQDGTPSPDNPVPIVSAGDSGNITVSMTGGGTEPQSLIYPTPNGLPGIPVSSGGNYTDESGQQWVCDEVDFGRGVYVKNIAIAALDGTESWNKRGITQADAYQTKCGEFVYNNAGYMVPAISNIYPYNSSSAVGSFYVMGHGYISVAFASYGASTIDQLKDLLRETNMIVYGKRSVPEEIPISPAELSVYAALHTNYPTTTVVNDSDAGMEVGYKSKPVSSYKFRRRV